MSSFQSALPGTAENGCAPGRTLRDIFTGYNNMKAQNLKDKPTALLPVTESPAGRSPDPNSIGTPAAEAVNSSRRSPLGRSVVTALEAELNEVGAKFSAFSLVVSLCRGALPELVLPSY